MFSVRRAKPRDTEQCDAMVRGLPDYFAPETADRIVGDLTAHAGWIVCHDEHIAGFAVVDMRSPRAAEILWIAVDDAERGNGAGTVLLDQLFADLAAEGIELIEVKSLDRSSGYAPFESTRAFWERRGFVQIDMIDPLPGWEPGTPVAIYVAAIKATLVEREPSGE